MLRDECRLTPDESAHLEELYEWLNEHVPVPPYSSRRWPRDVVAWFRDDATEAIARMRDLVALLAEHDVEVRMLRSANPGRVVYEDAVQVVVEEWNEL